MVKLNFPNDSKERALKRLEEIRKINTAIANKTTIKKKTAKKTNKEVKSEKLITITGEIDSKTDIFNLSNASIEFLTENKNIAKEISKIINNILNDKKEEVKELNIEKLNPIIRKCEEKIIEIKDIIKDFDYSDKKTYEELTSKVESDLKELENIKNVNKINEIIDEINKIYRNAYNKKNNVSSLSYIMETDENIDLINKIDIENLE
ncbi:hypothetical protein EPJ70_12175 [Brachyspira aalborgi]|uniref:Uncharacterized protein n=1 Tax=Brachyspira aalborgi TaxID=29522 RepID=A0A5C8EXF2_9SPIR|nr:hypothetical protein [Brachyspira aalborgi]TXJ42697.1 hypothetical protein EPJ70_12175 [Brachyspira aalborgi]